MVAIDNFTPPFGGVALNLDQHIATAKEIVALWFDKNPELTAYIVEGLIQVLSHLGRGDCPDSCFRKQSRHRKILKSAMISLRAQAEAIVTLQLYRLTNTDVVVLEEEEAELREDCDVGSHYR